jgi:prepilin-type N-terminal cleavage/methylation domain-containing protein
MRDKNHKAFTLIELLVVVAIIGILAAVGVVAYNGYTKSAKDTVTKSNISLIKKKLILDMTTCDMVGKIEIKQSGGAFRTFTNCSSAFNDLQNHMQDIKSPYADATAKAKQQDIQLWGGNCCTYGKEGRTYYSRGNFSGQQKIKFLTYLSDNVVQEDFVNWPY